MAEALAPFADLALTEGPDGVTLPIRAMPRAALDGVSARALRVRLAAPPVEGAASKALIAGEKARHKRVVVRGLTCADVLTRLRAWTARGA